MSAQSITARGITGGRRAIAGRVGKGPVIGVAIVALVVAAVLGVHALTQPGSASHDTKAAHPSVFIPAVSTAQYDDDLMSQQEDWIHATAARATAQPICTDAPARGALCYMPQADGTWAVERLQADGLWVRTGTQMHAPSSEDLQRGYSG